MFAFGRKWYIVSHDTGHAIKFRAWTKWGAKARAKRIADHRGWSGFRMVGA